VVFAKGLGEVGLYSSTMQVTKQGWFIMTGPLVYVCVVICKVPTMSIV